MLSLSDFKTTDLYRELTALLEDAATTMHIKLTQQQSDLLLDFIYLVKKWNQSYNITAIEDYQEMVIKHILDSISISNFLVGTNFLDIGTGAGFPGVPLAILNPEKNFYLLDSSYKKIASILFAKSTLKLTNIYPVHTRIEKYQPPCQIDGILSRALSSFGNIVDLTKHCKTEHTKYFFLKAKIDQDEVENLFDKFSIQELNIPYLNATRNLIISE